MKRMVQRVDGEMWDQASEGGPGGRPGAWPVEEEFSPGSGAEALEKWAPGRDNPFPRLVDPRPPP